MLQKIAPESLQRNIFTSFREQWTLITAGTAAHCNTMTASWGGLGVLWNKNVATIYIRPQRYTREFIEKHDFFTLSFFSEDYREQLKLCGAKSGRDIDKVKECGFTVKTAQCGAPYFGEAELVLACKKMYYSDLNPHNFLDPEIEQNYPKKDYHRLYIGEVVEAYAARA